MLSPRPLPENRRVLLVSACENALKMIAWSASEMPIPVSRTSNRSSAESAVASCSEG